MLRGIDSAPPNPTRMPRGFAAVVAAAFLSALADHALLIVAIALLERQGHAGWWAPMLKFGFMLAYVLLAPFVGPLADAFAKGRVMAAMNGVKALGLIALLLGLHPVAALAIVGLGAASYAPAKYGLITELVPPERLVAANAWLEVSVVCAVLLGTVLGGALVSPQVLEAAAARQLASAAAAAHGGAAEALTLSTLALLGAYLLAGVVNAAVPDSGARYHRGAIDPPALLRRFAAENRTLWRDGEGGLSLAVTTLFWGFGATLQFAVLRWAVERLGLGLDRAAYLQAAVAVGVAAGAAAAGRWVPLRQAPRLLGLGVLLGLLVPMAAQLQGVVPAALMLALIGALGGWMVVPMNALLQHRGFVLLSAGRSIAVQGFNENLGVLAMLAVYAALLVLRVPIMHTMAWMGLLMAAGIAALMWRRRRRH